VTQRALNSRMNLRSHSFQEFLLPSAQPAAPLPDPSGGAARPVGDAGVIETDIAPRLDRLPWDRFHTLVVVALGITWILDGLEVTLAGSLAGALEASRTLQFTTVDVGLNSAIQELIPARYRGRTDLAINGSFWVGAALGAGVSIVLLGNAPPGSDLGWRLAFLVGALLGLVILFMRMWIPESPRWLVTHGHGDAAHAVVAGIEARVRSHGHTLGPVEGGPSRLRVRTHTPIVEVVIALVRTYGSRTLVGLCLMAAQAFFYNAIFFTYALILTNFYGIPAANVGWYILPFALGNFLGPLLLGRFFDTIGRKTMIAATYTVSGLLLCVTGWLFSIAVLSAEAQTIAWMVIFFFASAAASSAYLTVGEIFPLEIRAIAIAFFYAVGTGIGGVSGPLLFGWLIASGSRASVFVGYLIGSVLMIAAGVVEWIWGIAAERRPLEAIARPLAFVD
jgi:MFS family permease